MPTEGTAFISVKQIDRPRAIRVAKTLHEMGFSLVATKGTAGAIAEAGIPVTPVNKVQEGRPHVVDMLKNGEISLLINSVERTAQRQSRTPAPSAPPRWRSASPSTRPSPAPWLPSRACTSNPRPPTMSIRCSSCTGI